MLGVLVEVTRPPLISVVSLWVTHNFNQRIGVHKMAAKKKAKKKIVVTVGSKVSAPYGDELYDGVVNKLLGDGIALVVFEDGTQDEWSVEELTIKKTTGKATAQAKKREIGKTLSLSINATWVHLFQTNAKVKRVDRMTNQQMLDFMVKEFPMKKGTTNFTLRGVVVYRSMYNAGRLTGGEAPAKRSVQYDEEGNVKQGRGLKKTTTAPAKKKVAAKKKAPAKKKAVKKAPIKKKKVAVKKRVAKK